VRWQAGSGYTSDRHGSTWMLARVLGDAQDGLVVLTYRHPAGAP
jgi:hypothetical protein